VIFAKKHTAKFCYIKKYALLCGVQIIAVQSRKNSGIFFVPIHKVVFKNIKI
jgi:hypothetical protein